MFSSTELISFVFANESDVYYGDDLIKRDLNQYLWDRLHQNYKAVYFLSAESNGFAVRSYGDLCCKEYTPGRKTFFNFCNGGSTQREFGNWLQRQLRGKSDEAAAFVCSLEDFCTVLSDSQWDSVLREILETKNRTGIFVLTASATAERTAKLFLESPVFEKLQESTVVDLRSGTKRELYGALKKRKGDNCVFLNTFSWERLRAVLLHLVMENSDRCESYSKLDMMTDYLYAYCRNPDLADRETLFRREMPVDYLLYTNLYDQLSNERTWQKFQEASQRYQKIERGSLSAELRVPVLRDKNSYAGRCMKIKLPGWIVEDEELAEQSAGLLRKICQDVSVPMNRAENQEIISAAEEFLNQLEVFQPGDLETYVQMLNALRFCVNHVYTEPEDRTEQIIKVIQMYRDAISVCQAEFLLERQLTGICDCQPEGKLHSVALDQTKEKLMLLKQGKKRYFDLISAMELELGLKMPDLEKNDSSWEKLEQEVRDFRLLAEIDTAKAIPDSEKHPEPEKEEKKKFVITDSLFRYKPPVID